MKKLTYVALGGALTLLGEFVLFAKLLEKSPKFRNLMYDGIAEGGRRAIYGPRYPYDPKYGYLPQTTYSSRPGYQRARR
jgi:hypothetical protein